MKNNEKKVTKPDQSTLVRCDSNVVQAKMTLEIISKKGFIGTKTNSKMYLSVMILLEIV